MTADELPDRLAHVRTRMAQAAERARREPDAVRLIAVSKTIPAATVQRALEAGITDLGENRVQEAQEKIPSLAAWPARWHLIGHLQSNKVAKALDLFAVIHSIDSVELATLVSRRQLARTAAPATVLLEVNVAGEATKQGFTPERLLAAAPALAALPGLRLAGLMTVAPAVTDPEEVRPVFHQLRDLRIRLADRFGAEFRELSMGMSHDYGVAIEEGATMVRVGTAIFGPRG